jgi:hypothetical protein
MSETALLFRRSGQLFGRVRKLRLYIDGAERGRLRGGNELRVEVEPGEHEVFTKMDWARSAALTVTVADGETVALDCRSRRTAVAVVLSLVRPGRVFTVSRAQESRAG